jgi:hypothetical protein
VEWTTKQGTEGGLQLTPRNQIPQSNWIQGNWIVPATTHPWK